MATGEDKAFAMAKTKFKKAKTKLRQLIDEEKIDSIPATVEQVEKTWSEFDEISTAKISAGNSENDEELESEAVKYEREKDDIISEAKNMIEPNMKTGAKNKTRTDWRWNQQRSEKVKWSDITKRKDNMPPGKGSLYFM